MSVMEKQAALGRDLFELNTGALRRLAELQVDGVRKYFAVNKTFAEQLPQVTDVQSFMELQRKYGQAVWEGFTDSLKSNGAVLKDTAESTGELLRNVFSNEAPAAPQASKKSTKSASAAAAPIAAA